MQTTLQTWLKKQPAGQSKDVRSEPKRQGTNLPTPPPEEISKDSMTTDPSSMSKGEEHQKDLDHSLHPQVSIEPLSLARLPAFKRLNSTLLQIPYTAQFYTETLTDPVISSLTLIATWHDTPVNRYHPTSPSENIAAGTEGRLVAGIRGRLLTPPSPTSLIGGRQPARSEETRPMLYLSTLCVLSPYQGHGIATYLFNQIVRLAQEKYNVDAVGAHVWEANTEAREWYRKRGFTEEKILPEYYRRLSPSGAVVVRKDLG